MEIIENKLSSEMFGKLKDIVAGAFKYETGNFNRSKYIVEKLRNIYGTANYNFCCIVGDKYSYDAFYHYYSDVYFKCYFENKKITLFSGK